MDEGGFSGIDHGAEFLASDIVVALSVRAAQQWKRQAPVCAAGRDLPPPGLEQTIVEETGGVEFFLKRLVNSAKP